VREMRIDWKEPRVPNQWVVLISCTEERELVTKAEEYRNYLCDPCHV
jgi:hypothetical protein